MENVLASKVVQRGCIGDLVIYNTKLGEYTILSYMNELSVQCEKRKDEQ
ncbi:MAG: hypothetical protein IBX41_05990 [Methanophagales archaeon]|nr:hypothetical protein [Methanophagales archaeon]